MQLTTENDFVLTEQNSDEDRPADQGAGFYPPLPDDTWRHEMEMAGGRVALQEAQEAQLSFDLGYMRF